MLPFFHSERMDAVRIISLEVGTTGDQEFDPEAEKAEHERKEWHDRWLASVLGESGSDRFEWGSVLSAFDSRPMSSQIVIRYREAGQ